MHVLTTYWRLENTSSFLEVLEYPGIIIHKIPSLGFHGLKYAKGKNHISEFLYKGFNFVFRKISKPFYYLDEAQQFHHIMIPYVKWLLKKEAINTLIATGAPFSVNYAAAKIKKQLGNKIKLIQDFRDPWNDLELYSTTFGNKRRKIKSKKMESFSFLHSDYIVTVTKGLARLFLKNTGYCSY